MRRKSTRQADFSLRCSLCCQETVDTRRDGIEVTRKIHTHLSFVYFHFIEIKSRVLDFVFKLINGFLSGPQFDLTPLFRSSSEPQGNIHYYWKEFLNESLSEQWREAENGGQTPDRPVASAQPITAKHLTRRRRENCTFHTSHLGSKPRNLLHYEAIRQSTITVRRSGPGKPKRRRVNIRRELARRSAGTNAHKHNHGTIYI